jgi:ubiquinone/menaquinone biosynthesis C-methylase UbiE
MRDSISWRRVWEDKSKDNVPDFELDRGISPRDREIENLSEKELVNFIEPRDFETLLDAGCGTGVNILRLHSRVRNIIAIDFAWGSLERCQRRIQSLNIKNVHLYNASATAIPLPDCSVDKILCLSVLQYLDDEEFRQAVREFVRVLAPGGLIVLHVKNLSSLYWSTLWLAKRLKSLLGMSTRIEYFRSFRWYVNELESFNCHILDYNSFNLLYVDRMPKRLLSFFQRLELRHHSGPLFRTPFVRRHGAELKIKARVADRRLEPLHSETTTVPPRAPGPGR